MTLGNFIKRAKIQSFLYASEVNQFQRLGIQDRVNMETGETKVFVYKDTLDLTFLEEEVFKISDETTLTLHSKDSLIIHYNDYNISYVRLSLPKKKVKVKKIKKVLIDNLVSESVLGEINYFFTYQDNGLVKVSKIDMEREWESDYQFINFNEFLIIQGIVSAPKLVLKVRKKEINFIEIDYRFENKSGILKRVN